MKTNLLGLSPAALTQWCAELGEKPFRAKQLQRWVHQRRESDFAQMTDLAKSFRDKLASVAVIEAPPIISDHVSADGTRKWLLDVGSGDAIEMVYIPEVSRATLCISTQAGCAVNCSFCSTGKQGFSRNLNLAEVVGQLWLANRLVDTPISNVVFMGMGEPLQNYQVTIDAVRIMLDDNAYGLSRRKVTVSTSGVVPMMDRLGQDVAPALAVSLHASNDALRNDLVPLNKKYPLVELMAACQRYLEVAPRDFITFEYVMLKGVNDSVEQAQELLNVVKNVPCKFNLIPFNPFAQAQKDGSALESSGSARIKAFAQVLIDDGIVTTVRKTRGDDIDAACGQLAGDVKDRTKLLVRMATKPKRLSQGAPVAVN